MAGGFAAGAALYGHHDLATAVLIADYRARRAAETDAEVLAAAAALERPEARRHPLCAELRAIVDAELSSRHLSLAPLAGGAK